MVQYCCVCKYYTRFASDSSVSFHRFPSEPNINALWINAIGRKNFVPRKDSRLCSAHFRDSDFLRTVPKKVLNKDAVPSLFGHTNELQPQEHTVSFPLVEIKCEFTETEDETFVDHDTKLSDLSSEKDPFTSIPTLVYNNAELSNLTVKEEPCTSTSANNSKCNIINPEEPSTSTCLSASIELRSFNMESKRAYYFGDFTEEDMESPRKAKLAWKIAKDEIDKKNKQLKLLRIKNARQEQRILSLKHVVQQLKKSKRVSDDYNFFLNDEDDPCDKQE